MTFLEVTQSWKLLEVTSLTVLAWLAYRLEFVGKLVRNLQGRLLEVEEFLGKGGNVSLKLDVDGLKQLGAKLGKEEGSS
jgi:hypothetical protein